MLSSSSTKSRRRRWVIAGPAALALASVLFPGSASAQGTAGSGGSPGGGTSAAQALQNAFVAVVHRVRPEVVEISTRSDLGSGIIYDDKGDIVTNDHVVGTATSFSVTLFDGKTYSARLVGTYEPDDLAMIRLNGATKLQPATFGNSAALQVGDIVMAVGSPLGLSSSVTEGIVSYNGRLVSEDQSETVGNLPVVLANTVQTSAAINPGNSGGALVDLQGDVVGIPTLAASDQQVGGAAPGIGFAIPSNTVKLIASQLVAGKVTRTGRAGLGVEVSDAFDNNGNPSGSVIRQVEAGSAAAKAGLKVGDLIVGVGGHKVQSSADLASAMAGFSPGQRVKVSVIVTSSGAKETFEVTLEELPGQNG
jgi:putative serine protease PepD